MLRSPFVAAAIVSVFVIGAAGSALAKARSPLSKTCTDSQTMKIPLSQLNKCAIDGGVMRCTPSGYECCYDNDTVCEWMPYSIRRPGPDIAPPSGDRAPPTRPKRPGSDIRPPDSPKAPPRTQLPRGPRFDVGAGPRTLAPLPSPALSVK